jgi:hypothetical protein
VYVPTVSLWKTKHPKLLAENGKLEGTGLGYNTLGGITTTDCAVMPLIDAVMTEDPVPTGVTFPLESMVRTEVFPLIQVAPETALTLLSEYVPTADRITGVVLYTTFGEILIDTKLGPAAALTTTVHCDSAMLLHVATTLSLPAPRGVRTPAELTEKIEVPPLKVAHEQDEGEIGTFVDPPL